LLIGFKTELKPNNQQKTLFAKHCGVARHAWNKGVSAIKFVLEHNKNNPQEKLKIPTAIDLHKWLVASVKPDYPWYYEVSKCAPQQALRNLSTALSDFLKKKKIRGKVVSFPRYKKKGKHDSFYLDGSLKTDHFAIKLPRIGWVKTYERLPQGFTPKNVTISRKADRWFVSFKVEVTEENTPPSVPPIRGDERGVVGVDLGIKTLATLSSKVIFEGAKSYKRFEKKLSRLQYLLRKKVKFSNNWYKAQEQIARLHLKIADIRKDTLHKLTTYLAKNHGTVVIEDLNVSGMMSNHRLAKAIQDMGFYEFRRQLEYKTKLYGGKLVIANRFFPSSKTCSHCDFVKTNLQLSDRVFKCDNCGLEIERDFNASINLEKQVS
jgi:putative transposase